MLFLENNHGKWLADILFGQLQIRRKRCTVLGIESLLSDFELINRKNGPVQGFAMNPTASVDFSEVLAPLGYETKPPKDSSFLKRNIHFATACAPGAKSCLTVKLKTLIGELLPSKSGMVRICSDPPSGRSQAELTYESRCRCASRG